MLSIHRPLNGVFFSRIFRNVCDQDRSEFKIYYMYQYTMFMLLWQCKEMWACEKSIALKGQGSPNWCSSVGWVLSRKMKGHRFDSRAGCMPGLWFQAPRGTHERQRISVSPPPLCPSLPLSLKIKE